MHTWEHDRQILINTLSNFHETSPFAPYVGYVVLSVFTLLFFLLWRRAAFKAEVARKTAASLVYALGSPTQQHEQALRTIQQIQSEALLTVRNMQSEAIIKLAASHTQALVAVENVVKSFTENDEEE